MRYNTGGMFWAADVLFIVVHIVLLLSGWWVQILNIEMDQSYPELFQYLKFFWLFYLSVVLSIRYMERAFFFVGLIFLILLLDDAFSLHEFYGSKLASSFSVAPILGLRLQDYGEMIIFLILGLAVLLLWLLAYIWVQARHKKILEHTGKMLVILGGFAVVVDMLHQITKGFGRGIYLTVGIVEDGGEMIVLSALLATFVSYSLLEPERTVRI